MNAEDVVNEYKDLLPIPIIEEAKEEIKNRRIGAEKAKEIMERIKQEYENALIDPGESIGIITAESFGEPGTQMTLNVFHFAGVAEVSVTLGLPRLIELFDARKIPSTPVLDVFIKKQYAKDEKKVREIASMLKETKLADISEEFSLNLTKVRIEAYLDSKRMKDLKIMNKYLLRILNKR